jgi:glutaredoxin
VTAVVTVYVRPGCHLCSVALDDLRELRREQDFSLDVVDIETDDALHARYLERIPVIALDGHELYDFAVDAADLSLRLRTVESGGR